LDGRVDLVAFWFLFIKEADEVNLLRFVLPLLYLFFCVGRQGLAMRKWQRLCVAGSTRCDFQVDGTDNGELRAWFIVCGKYCG
jgi:hypothetical protein